MEILRAIDWDPAARHATAAELAAALRRAMARDGLSAHGAAS